MKTRHLCLFLALALVSSLAQSASAAVIYSDDFNLDTSALYNKFVTAGATGPSGDATFVYDYGAAPGSGGLAAPVAPHPTDSATLGLLLRTDNLQIAAGTAVGE